MHKTTGIPKLEIVIKRQSLFCVAIIALIYIVPTIALAQQVPDTLFRPVTTPPKYPPGKGPKVMIDEAHHNFHTSVNRFKPFALLLKRDGYNILRGEHPFTTDYLKTADIVVISNALNEKNLSNWTLPTPSAFTDEEIQSLKVWVEGGGSLFLIADHMPFPGNAEQLAAAFGFKFYNGFALTEHVVFAPDLFCLANHRLQQHEVTAGLDSIRTFTGQGFDIPPQAQPVLALDEEFYMLMPETAWVFNDDTPRLEGKGKYQGATLQFGKGKVAVFGEAATFSAQIAQKLFKMGFNHENAKHNAQLALNVIHWLDEDELPTRD